jgi:hypothetical protein
MMTVQVNGTHEALINQHLIIKVMNAGVSLSDELILPTFHFVPDILQKPRRVDFSRKSRRFIGTSSPHPKRNRDQNILPLGSLNLVSFVTKSWPVTAPGSQGVFRGRGRGFGFLKNGRQAAIVLSWLLLVQLPGQVLRSYSSKVSKSKRFLIVKQILVYSVTAKLSTEQYLVVRYWFTRMR